MITFRGGVHPYDGKEYTKDKQIEKLEASQEVVFLMKQHIGAPSIPVVKAKDEVHRYAKSVCADNSKPRASLNTYI